MTWALMLWELCVNWIPCSPYECCFLFTGHFFDQFHHWLFRAKVSCMMLVNVHHARGMSLCTLCVSSSFGYGGGLSHQGLCSKWIPLDCWICFFSVRVSTRFESNKVFAWILWDEIWYFIQTTSSVSFYSHLRIKTHGLVGWERKCAHV